MHQIKNISLHRNLFTLAVPMILSNITIPLLGLVDTAVIGHLDQAYFLGGSTVGAMIITFILWLCGFLRMSTTGLAAQALGKKDNNQGILVLQRGIIVALIVSFLMLLLQNFYLDLSLYFAGGSAEVQFYARQYSEIRIWGLPAALSNLVILGWLLGNHQAKSVMWVLIVTNLSNLLLDLLFVLGFDWQVQGIAFATLISEYLGCLLGMAFVISYNHRRAVKTLNNSQFFTQLLDKSSLFNFFKLNRDILIRTLCLEICFVFITFQGARLGDDIVAANAILMNFLLLISFGLDGIANGAEAMVGKAQGASEKTKLATIVKISLFWTVIFALLYSLFFALFGSNLIMLITTIPSVIDNAMYYLPWMIILPLVSCWCYLYDGVYIGLMRAKAMRNSMFIATFAGFFPLWFLFQSYGNHGLWAAFSCFMLVRGITLAWHFKYRVYAALPE